MKYLLGVCAVLFVTACGGGGGSSTPTVYPVTGSYFGTVVSSLGNSGNMGITTDASGNGSFAVQYPGEPVIQESFAPPVASVSGSTLSINGTIAGSCSFKMAATMAGANAIAGTYSLTCPGQSTLSAHFSLARGSYNISSKFHRMTR